MSKDAQEDRSFAGREQPRGSGRSAEGEGVADGTRSAEGEVWVDAPPERVWRALTEARELERWFPLEAEVEPGEGGRIRMSWGNEYQEAMPIAAWDPPRHLRTSWPWGGGAVVTDYRIEAERGGTRLRVVTSGFPLDASWNAWVEGTRRGWAYELRALRHYLERMEGLDRRALFLRRRVTLSREETFARLTGEGGLAPRWTAGERIDHAPPVQVAVVLDDPPGAMMRASVEPVHPASGEPADGPRRHDATLWISLWGEQGRLVDDIDREWTATMERIFPDGETLRTVG